MEIAIIFGGIRLKMRLVMLCDVHHSHGNN